MRTTYHGQLDALRVQLGDMCGMTSVAMEQATTALLKADLRAAESVISDHDHITAMGLRVEENARILLALQAPVAGDLRIIVSTLKNAADVDRMGALALHIAKIARRRNPEHALPDEVVDTFAEMGRIAVELSNNASRVVLSCDPAEAARMTHDDDAIDEMHRHLFYLLLNREWKHGVPTAVDVTLLSRYYERFADHAVAVSRRVIYQATGSPA